MPVSTELLTAPMGWVIDGTSPHSILLEPTLQAAAARGCL
jgi:hypothetical protein